jgi:hypothetical protein
VYISDVDGTNVEVLSAATYGDRSNRTGPDWSPDGRLVAFQSLNGNSKQIMTINLRDQSVRSVASEGRNEDPSWAPDSRHLVYTSDRSGVRQLWVVDVETGRSRQLKTGSAARLAARARLVHRSRLASTHATSLHLQDIRRFVLSSVRAACRVLAAREDARGTTADADHRARRPRARGLPPSTVDNSAEVARKIAAAPPPSVDDLLRVRCRRPARRCARHYEKIRSSTRTRSCGPFRTL